MYPFPHIRLSFYSLIAVLAFFISVAIAVIIIQIINSLRIRILSDSALLGEEGFYIAFADSIYISARDLYQKGTSLPIKYEDFVAFAGQNLVDTQSGCDILQCSRQNISYIVNQKQLTPLKEDVKGNLYLKKDLLKKLW